MRKIAANYIFPIASKPIKNGYVVVDDNGTVIETGQLDGECQDTEFYNGILCPGFTNAHCHIELSHLKGLFKEDTGMSGFINQINELRSSAEKPERIKALEEQFDQLYSQGVSAMGDISNCDESFDIKAKSPLKTRSFIELFGTLPEEAEEVIESGKELEKKAVGVLRIAAREGDVKNGCVLAGQVAGMIDKEQTSREIITEMFSQAEEVLNGATKWVK